MNSQIFARWERSTFSLIDRLSYAKFHLTEATELFESCITRSSRSPFGIIFGQGSEDQEKLRIYRLKIGAHIIACVQNLHSLADIIAHVIYLSRADENSDNLSDRDISVSKVKNWSIKWSQSDAVSFLEKVSPNFDDGFKLLDALSNHGKHRSLVPCGLNLHVLKSPEDWYSIRFAQFTYNDTHFKSCDALSFLDKELTKLVKLAEQVLCKFQLNPS